MYILRNNRNSYESTRKLKIYKFDCWKRCKMVSTCKNVVANSYVIIYKNLKYLKTCKKGGATQ